jgi:hypothetical protein
VRAHASIKKFAGPLGGVHLRPGVSPPDARQQTFGTLGSNQMPVHVLGLLWTEILSICGILPGPDLLAFDSIGVQT